MITLNFSSIFDLLNTFPDEQSCIDHLEELRWNGNVVSPFSEHSKVYKCSGNRYKCKLTGCYFNVKTGTLFDSSNIKLQKWFLAIFLITSHKKGISSVQLAKDVGTTQKTAWFMLQRIRNCFGDSEGITLSDEVEVDETYVGGKNKNRHASKKVKSSQGRSLKDKSAVFGMIERNGKLIAKVVENVQEETLTDEIKKHVDSEAKIYSDEWMAYKKLNNIFKHEYVKHNSSEYVRERVHTNTIEGFWSLLKRGIIGIYHHVSKKHIQFYVDEFSFRYNSKHFSTSQRFNTFLLNFEKRLTYKMLINGGENYDPLRERIAFKV